MIPTNLLFAVSWFKPQVIFRFESVEGSKLRDAVSNEPQELERSPSKHEASCESRSPGESF